MMIIRLGDKIINKTVAEYLLQNMYRYIIINVTPIIKVTPFDGIYKKFLLPRRLNLNLVAFLVHALCTV